MKEYLFVDEKQNIFTDEEARKKLQNVSDAKFITEEKGILKITDERWNLAQSYEQHYWMKRAVSSNDDRNIDHFYEFEKFAAIQGKQFKHAIELGCGPFTNLRLISAVVDIEECTLEDPLIDSYLTHPHCTYKDKKNLFVQNLRLDPFIVRAIRKVTRYFSKNLASRIKYYKNSSLPIWQLINLPIEDLNLPDKYDLVVLINVIEHCKDIQQIFKIITNICSSDSIFIFSDKYYYYPKIEKMVNGQCFEAGHPLLIDRKVVESFLHTNFTPVFEKIIKKEHNINGFDWSYDSVYFIGKFKGPKKN